MGMTPLTSPKGPLFLFFWHMTQHKDVWLFELLVFKCSSSFRFHLTSYQLTNGEWDESSQGHIEG